MLKWIFAVLGLTISGIAGLEYNLSQAPTVCPSRAAPPDVPEKPYVSACERYAPGPSLDEVNQRSAALLRPLIERRAAGEYISPEEYQAIGSQLLVVAPSKDFSPNGLACNGGYVILRDDLPPAAHRYVLQHELEHLLEWRSEAATNYAAAQIQPWGMVVTVLDSAYGSLTNDKRCTRCNLASLWFIFKIYFIYM